MTTIKATNSVIDGHGRVLYRRGSTYSVDDAEAGRLIQAGYAQPYDPDFAGTIEALQAGGIVGVVAGQNPAPKLLAAAEAGGLTVHDDLEVEHESAPDPKRRRRG